HWGWSGALRTCSALWLAGALLSGAELVARAQAAQTFNVTESNFVISGAPSQVRAGAPLVFNVTSSGFPHNLAIDGNGVDLEPTTPNIQNGTGTVTFPALQPGTYHLYCPVGQHRANGMDVTFTVVAGAAAAPAGRAAALPRTGARAMPLGAVAPAAAGAASGI